MSGRPTEIEAFLARLHKAWAAPEFPGPFGDCPECGCEWAYVANGTLMSYCVALDDGWWSCCDCSAIWPAAVCGTSESPQ